MRLTVDGVAREWVGDPEMPLPWNLCDRLDLTGMKSGCGVGRRGSPGQNFQEDRTRSKFHNDQVVRMGDAPVKVHVHLIQAGAPPAGIGEMGVLPGAGTRIRDLPLGKALRAKP